MKLIFIFLSILVLFTISCKTPCSDEFDIGYALKKNVDEVEYCQLIQLSLTGDSISFNELLQLTFNDGAIIYHSRIIHLIVNKVGLERVCSWIRSGAISEEELLSLLGADGKSYLKKMDIFIDQNHRFNCD